MSQIAGVIRQVVGIEAGTHRVAAHLFGGGKDRGDTHHAATVIIHRLNGTQRGVAGGHRSGQDQHMLALHHGYHIIPQHQLATHRMLGGQHVDSLVGVHIHIPIVGQLIRQAGADYLGAVQTQDGIHRRRDIVIRQQLLRHGLSLRQTHLLGGHVDIIIGMAVTGGKMTTGHAQKQIFTFRRDLERFFGRHSGTPYRDCYLTFYTISRKLTRGKWEKVKNLCKMLVLRFFGRKG